VPSNFKVRSFESIQALASVEKAVADSAAKAAKTVAVLLQREPALTVLRKLKFDSVGADPLDDRPLNFIEQLNQTFTYLATFDAVRFLFGEHPDRAPFTVSLGTAPGHDIVSSDGSVVAEVFAAVRPESNRKLAKDLRKLHATSAPYKYVFYSCPNRASGEVAASKTYPEIRIISLGDCGPT